MKMIDKFFEMQRERYRMLVNRRTGMPRPWTTDPILDAYRFCNVFREDDKTTTWFRENLRNPLNEMAICGALLRATVAFRWFNRIASGEKIKDMLAAGRWDSKEAEKALFLQEPVVTGAFIVKTPAGMDKLRGVLWCIDQIAPHCYDIEANHTPGETTMEATWKALRNYPYMGPFMAHEVVTDLSFTWMLKDAPDRNTWTNMGPGATKGMGYIVHGDEEYWNSNSAQDQEEMTRHARAILQEAAYDNRWPSAWPRWDLHTVEFGLCEFAKYQHALEGKKLKRRYQ